MLKYDFQESIGYWLLMASRSYEKAVNELLAEQGLTYRQCQVLGWLALEGDLSQSELAERLQVEPPTLVPILDRMEELGWLKRKPCSTDRRRKLVTPTAAAKPAWKKIVAVARKTRAKATDGMTKTEVATLKRLLGKLRENLNADQPVEMTT